jgi:hypothetical protein
LNPIAGPEDVLVKMNATGVCHSDLHYMMNDWGLGPMSQHSTKCAGHEGAGVIVKVGRNVRNLKVGQRAGFKPVANVDLWLVRALPDGQRMLLFQGDPDRFSLRRYTWLSTAALSLQCKPKLIDAIPAIRQLQARRAEPGERHDSDSRRSIGLRRWTHNVTIYCSPRV